MTKVTMPEPSAEIRTIAGIEIFDLTEFGKSAGITVGAQFITTTQAEAYADARVRVALEEAAQLCDGQHFGGDNDDDLGWTSCAANLAHAIRALIPPTE